MIKPKIYADFHNADLHSRLRLNCVGTLEDLSRQQVQLCEGLQLLLYSDDPDAEGRPGELQADGVVAYSAEENGWVATIVWEAIRHVPTVTSLIVPAETGVPSIPAGSQTKL